MRCLCQFVALLIPVTACAQVEFSDTWIKNLPPTIPVRGGYLMIHNPQSQPVSIVAVRNEAFASAPIHRSRLQDGMLRMDPIARLTIAPGETVQLAPRGIH